MRKKIYGIIWEEQLQRGVAAEISQALMEEVYTTPKPGLVDREDTGAHTDMNCQTFQKSTEAIAEDLAAMLQPEESIRTKESFLRLAFLQQRPEFP